MKTASFGNELAVNVTMEEAMVFPGYDWAETCPESQGVDSTKLTDAMSYLASVSGRQGTSQALVIRNGYLIWKGNDIDNKHNIWSATKSFTGTVLGILIDQNRATLDTLAKDYVRTLEELYPNVTLRHFATLTSGYDSIGGDQSSKPFNPTTPLFPPGTKFLYWDSAMNQFANVLTQIAGEPIENLFKREIADEIGMNSSKWSWGNWGTIDGILLNGGAGNKKKGISISAREFAKFGHLFLNRGNWNGAQLISLAFVDQATSVQVPPSLPGDSRIYGFNLWVNGIKPDGNPLWPAAPPRTYQAAGYNNNRCIIIPEYNMVIVRLGTDGDAVDINELNTFLEKIGESIIGS